VLADTTWEQQRLALVENLRRLEPVLTHLVEPIDLRFVELVKHLRCLDSLAYLLLCLDGARHAR